MWVSRKTRHDVIDASKGRNKAVLFNFGRHSLRALDSLSGAFDTYLSPRASEYRDIFVIVTRALDVLGRFTFDDGSLMVFASSGLPTLCWVKGECLNTFNFEEC